MTRSRIDTAPSPPTRGGGTSSGKNSSCSPRGGRGFAITLAHEAGGIRPAPTQELEVRLVMRGIRRQLGVAPRSEATPLSVAQLREMASATPEESLRDVRDHCVLLLGFAGALRRSEIVFLDCSDVQEIDGGLLLRIRRSKTDPEAAGQEIGIPRGSHQETDPVIALQRWRRLAHLEIPDLYGHSLRAGFATAAAQAGATERAIASQTHHRSLTTLRRHIRRGTLFEENAAGMLGL